MGNKTVGALAVLIFLAIVGNKDIGNKGVSHKELEVAR